MNDDSRLRAAINAALLNPDAYLTGQAITWPGLERPNLTIAHASWGRWPYIVRTRRPGYHPIRSEADLITKEIRPTLRIEDGGRAAQVGYDSRSHLLVIWMEPYQQGGEGESDG